MRMLSVNLLFIGILVASFASRVAGQTPIGYVLEIQGDWYLNGSSTKALKRWQKLPPAGTISIPAPSPDALIVIASLAGEIIDSRSCAADTCSLPIKLPVSKAQRSLLRVAFEATAKLLWGDTDRYKIARIRTLGGALSEGVDRLEGGEIDFSLVVREVGPHYLRWRARPLSSGPAKWSSPVRFRTKPGQSSLIAVSHFKPGLYEVNLQRATIGGYETFASAWVLVSISPRYESAATLFRQAVRLTEQWGTKVEPTTSRQFLRAHLEYLAGQEGK